MRRGNPGEILVIRQSAFGDILHLLPALSALKKALAGARLILLVKPPYRALASRAPFIDEVRTEIGLPVDAVVDCQGLLRTAWISLRSGARLRAGLSWGSAREKPASLLYNRRVKVGAAHIIDRHAELLSGALGVPVAVDRGFRAVFLVRGSREAARFLDRVAHPRVLVHPFSSREGKHLAVAEWKPVLDLVRARGAGVVLSCGPGEEGLLEAWREAAPWAVTAPVLPLDDLPALAAGCRLMIGPDTGVTHLADQLGIPVLSRFSLWPPERNGPYFSPGLVFWRRPPDAAEVAAWLDGPARGAL